jgi:hypothetical protein
MNTLTCYKHNALMAHALKLRVRMVVDAQYVDA